MDFFFLRGIRPLYPLSHTDMKKYVFTLFLPIVCKNIVTFSNLLYPGDLLLGELEDGGEDGNQPRPLLPAQGQELEDHVLDVLEVLDVLVPLLAPLVGSDLFL